MTPEKGPRALAPDAEDVHVSPVVNCVVSPDTPWCLNRGHVGDLMVAMTRSLRWQEIEAARCSSTVSEIPL